MRILTFLLICLLPIPVISQADLLRSGPMLGYSDMREVLLWVQTTEAAEVQFAYWPTGQSEKKHLTRTNRTQASEAFTAKLIADQVQAGLTYDYQLLINGFGIELPYPTRFSTQPQWRGQDEVPDFSVALGSCANIEGDEYDRPEGSSDPKYNIFQSIYEQQPDIMIWLGDNIYLENEEWFTMTGIFHRYTHSRSLPELQPLLAGTHHYAIWDDHDFGPNDSDRSFIHKDKTLEAFRLFWGNPTFGTPEITGAITAFSYMDIDFFLLDDRYHRSPNGRESGERTILGEAQLEWLIDALTYSKAPYKMVAIGGQVLNTAPVFENYANHHAAERQYLLRRIEEEGITGLVFLTGDRHHTELSRYVNNRGHAVYDLTISPLTSRSYDAEDEDNRLRVPGTQVGIHNFGILEFTGPAKARRLLIKVFDTQGKLLWQQQIPPGE